jgi:hypothetical protein
MVWEALVAVARLERLDYCAIWMMHVRQILVTLMPYARRVPSMVHLLAHARKDIKDQIVLRILMNVIKVDFVLFLINFKMLKINYLNLN